MSGQGLAGEFAHNPPLGHDKHAIAEIGELFRFGGYDENRHAAAGESADKPMDFGAGADVDAARGLVQNQHLRLRLQPSSDDDLLLVAAAQLADRRLYVCRLDRKVADRPLGEPLAAACC